jgi:molybdopterin molybdotransferase
MLTVEQLEAILAQDTPPPRVVESPLEQSLGRALAEEIRADRDSPPFDRSMMDGFAIRTADGLGPLIVVEEVPAGRVGARTLAPGECVRIMTGAPVPPSADAVVPHEKTRLEDGLVRLLEPARPGDHIARRGEEARAGDLLLAVGARMDPAAVAVAASAGRSRLRLFAKPSVAVLATGDELVDAAATPRDGQIRNSNGPMIAAQVRGSGFSAEPLGIARDDRSALRGAIAGALERHPVLILSGGVSAGAYDLVIQALREEGVESVAHKVALKPGKPIFYGRRGDRRVFGLPGNPLSSFVTFELFVRSYLGRMAGLDLRRPRVRAALNGEIRRAIDRVHLVPARLESGRATPVFPASSGDILCMTRANAFIMVPARAAPAPGDEVDVMRLDA